MTTPDVSLSAEEVKRLSRKAIWRVMPLVGFLGLVAYLDRISIAFAGPLGMNKELGLTATAFGFAVSILTIGYVIFEVPTAGLLAKFGTRLWVIRIMLTWGVIQVLIGFAPNKELLYLGRFLLGVAEAGINPALYFFISVWFIRSYRPLAYTLYGVAIGLSGVFGPLIANGLVSLGTGLNFDGGHGWRFLLVMLGVLALLAVIPTALWLRDHPREAKWWTDTERRKYQAMLDADAVSANVPSSTIWQVLKQWRPWVMGFGYFAFFYAYYTISVWAPTIVLGFKQQFGTSFTSLQSAFITGIPTLIALVGALILGIIAGKRGRSGWLLVGTSIAGALGCLTTTVARGPWVLIIALGAVALAGSAIGLYLPIANRVFAGTGLVAALALINSMGASAGFFSPLVTGYLSDVTGNQNAGFYVMTVLLLVAAVISILAERHANRIERDSGVGLISTGRGTTTAGKDGPVPAP
ncbi:MFS transporter [Amycolatopsis japonica]